MGKRKSNKMEASSVKNNEYTTVDGCGVAESHFLSDTIREPILWINTVNEQLSS